MLPSHLANFSLSLLLVFSHFLRQLHAECTVQGTSENKTIQLLNALYDKEVTVNDEDREYDYKISFCKGQAFDDNTDVGVTQIDRKDSNKKRVIGRISKTSIKKGTDFLYLTYGNGEPYGSHCRNENKQAHIMIMCDQDNLLTGANVLDENNERTEDCYYLFEVRSSVACSDGSAKKLSFGWLLIILILIVAAVYLLLGFLYQRFVQGAKGIEQIPNLSFWVAVGGYAADGCDYVCRCNKDSREPKSYKGLGDDQLGLDEEEDQDENILPMY